jgi:hypothetical protein
MSKKTTIHVGDLVRFQYGKNKVTGTVKEERGPIGIKGRRLYLNSSSPEPEFSFPIELPVDDIELVKEPVSPDRSS